jgi:hypothetical protein
MSYNPNSISGPAVSTTDAIAVFANATGSATLNSGILINSNVNLVWATDAISAIGANSASAYYASLIITQNGNSIYYVAGNGITGAAGNAITIAYVSDLQTFADTVTTYNAGDGFISTTNINSYYQENQNVTVVFTSGPNNGFSTEGTFGPDGPNGIYINNNPPNNVNPGDSVSITQLEYFSVHF